MRILSVTAQKPDSTGSGVYLTEVVRELGREGHVQAVLAGVYREDEVRLPGGVDFFPVYFRSEELPFAIPGMSDKMPYESTVYSTMDDRMVRVYMEVFRRKIKEAVESFHPDLILCHHLYLVTALVRDCAREIPVYGFCHNTDLRQMKKHDLQRDFICEHMRELDGIFALHQAQKEEILEMYKVEESRVHIAGTGYNDRIFFRKADRAMEEEKANDGGTSHPVRLAFAGKVSQEKGVASLIRSLALVETGGRELQLTLAGGNGDEGELGRIRTLAEACPCPVIFAGRLPQEKLADVYNESDVFVLPSFYEGLPLTVMEALACGCKVVVTDLPGIRPFMETYVSHAPVFYVEPPRMRRGAEPCPEDLPVFERKLAEKIGESICAEQVPGPDLDRISWKAVCGRILEAAAGSESGKSFRTN